MRSTKTIKLMLLSGLLGFIYYACTQTIGPNIGTWAWPEIKGLNEDFSKDAGQLVILCIATQILLLTIVLKLNWQGLKATTAGIVAGLSLLPLFALGQMNNILKEVEKSGDYQIIDKENGTAEIIVGNKRALLTKELITEIIKKFPPITPDKPLNPEHN